MVEKEKKLRNSISHLGKRPFILRNHFPWIQYANCCSFKSI